MVNRSKELDLFQARISKLRKVETSSMMLLQPSSRRNRSSGCWWLLHSCSTIRKERQVQLLLGGELFGMCIMFLLLIPECCCWRSGKFGVGLQWDFNATKEEKQAAFELITNTTQIMRDLTPGSGAYFVSSAYCFVEHEMTHFAVEWRGCLWA